MTLFRSILQNHFFATSAFLVIVILGSFSYSQLPRQQDPTVNLNWVGVHTIVPGTSAADIETLVTDVLEEAVAKVADIRFISSTSRQDNSLILVRFNDITQRRFDERLNDLRREVQNVEADLPPAASRPEVIKATTATAFPTTMIAVTGLADDETLRFNARSIQQDLERFSGVDRVEPIGLRDPELQVLFDPSALVGLGISPSTLAETVGVYFRDIAAGSIGLGEREWFVRIKGTDANPAYLAGIPILSSEGEIPLRSIATVARGRGDASHLAQYADQPTVILSIYKKDDSNIIDLLSDINTYIAEQNERLAQPTGIRLVMLDDQTAVTRATIGTMQRNAVYGLLFVLFTTWALLGGRIAILISLSIVFVLAGTFLFLGLTGQTLNVIVLLGLIISLGMLVDDTVVVAEAIHYRLEQGMTAIDASLNALAEVGAPVTAAVLTTIAAFLPLVFVPGMLGEFMKIAPLVVAVALLLSLVEAFWILPSHVIATRNGVRDSSRGQSLRRAVVRRAQLRYGRLLVGALRHPKLTLMLSGGLLIFALGAVATGLVRTEFFATDSARLVFVNVDMPAGSRLEKTLETTLAIEERLRGVFAPDELRAMASYSGLQYSNRETDFGNARGQILISLYPQRPEGRSVDEIVAKLHAAIVDVPGPESTSVERMATGAPPLGKPISIKVRGSDYEEIRAAADDVMGILHRIPAALDVTDDAYPGQMELSVRLNPGAIIRTGLNPADVTRDLRLLTDGEVVAHMRDRGDKLEVRVRAQSEALHDIERFLHAPIGLPDGSSVLLGQLVHHEVTRGEGNIRHYNLRRAITVEADVDRGIMDTPAVERWVKHEWQTEFAGRYPNVDLDFSGEFDDIKESIEAIGSLFLLGLLLVYLILGTQFRSYVQPLLVLVTVPMALVGVLMGLLISQQPLSVFTMYGVVALAGIALNDAIVLISAANDRLRRGMNVMQAILYAATRRFVPIIITSVTTIAGLFSLAVGLGGKSLMWGPLASAIVWGLMISTLLTLFIVPVLYSLVTREPQTTRNLGTAST